MERKPIDVIRAHVVSSGCTEDEQHLKPLAGSRGVSGGCLSFVAVDERAESHEGDVISGRASNLVSRHLLGMPDKLWIYLSWKWLTGSASLSAV